MSQVFPAHWDVLPFSLAVKDATSEYSKLQKSEYLEQGRFPIVDQGQQKFGGYTNDESLVSLGGCPTIVFGDHTRIFKFIDEPFCLGADGAKVLEPKAELDKKFLFYYLSSLNIDSAGYSRHFKFLKENFVPVPPLSEQKRIAAILDKADAIRRKRQQAIQLADDFLRAVFLDMFGDPVTNPKGWPTSRVDNFCSLVRGSSPRPQGDPRFYGGPVPRLMVADLTRDGKLVTPMIDSLTEEGAKKSRPIEAGTVVMAVSGNVGLTSVLAIDACIHDGFIAFKELDDNRLRPAFLCDLMMFLKSTHASRQAGAIFQNLTTSQIKEMEIPIPPLALQDKFLSISRKATGLYGEDGFSLFESLSQKAFSGQL
ncbi:restriction endonuclease subunit S [Pseudomonas luteola]|uniref:restriction endonuclease subunit S n=1 Tax=Pseudomonas luteola TaxID=47886 RepID=UPI000910A809|nr:restriction endonuclease subunit S [Pseudomonas zeshuii]SHJ68665.1 type I restriction enzyme, S subunit [Pseudomonas zeshuii]